MKNLLIRLALAPVVIILFYIFIRDKYEKEPFSLLFIGVFWGIVISVPIVFCENIIQRNLLEYSQSYSVIQEAFIISFCVAAFVEEAFKFIVIYFLVWKNRNFNEFFDGIVYSVFVSLGFAATENILYVINPNMGGVETALLRAVFSVPAHGFFAVFMGYFIGLAKFGRKNKIVFLIGSFIVPFLLHGIYDFLLLSEIPFDDSLFILFYILMAFGAFVKMKSHSDKSVFKK